MDHATNHTFFLLQQRPHIQKHLSVLRSRLTTIPYHLRSCWLFTASDLKTIVGPCTVFAILQQLGTSSGPHPINLIQVLKVVCWTWINLLPFNIDNQRRSVEEDLLNKPWRPLPAGRMTPEQATVVMLILYPLAVIFGILIGAPIESVVLVALGIWYNDLGGANASWIMRNAINASGITIFLGGSLSVMVQNQYNTLTTLSYASPTLFADPILRTWLTILGCVIFSGIQTQDMYDQVGDKILNRKTMPLVLGDDYTRKTIAFPVMFWSWFCPCFWSLPAIGYIIPVCFGAVVARRTLSKRTVEDDRITSKLWNLWLVLFFTLPLQRALFV